MLDNFKYQCTRRPARQYPVIEDAMEKGQGLLGAGSGGDLGDHTDYKEGDYGISADTLMFTATGSMGTAATSPIIAILAGGLEGAPDGRIAVHGSQGVRITSGPPHQPPAANQEINGIEMQVGETQIISIKRGMLSTDNEIQLNPGLLVVDGGSGKVLINSDTFIKLQVANGACSITLTPAGIQIKGLLAQIN